MAKQQYMLPLKVKITADDPDKVIQNVAQAIYDAVDALTKSEGFQKKVKLFDAEYSIHKKMKDEDFED